MFRRQLLAVAGMLAAATLVAVLVASGTRTSAARADSPTKGLSAYVAPTNTGPLPACSQDGSDCTPTNQVLYYIHVVNRNPLTNQNGSRLTVPNAFDIDSIDEAIFVNGVHQADFDMHWTPPPNITPPPYRGSSARWPATVLCGDGPPCTDIQNPAVVPGEDIAVFSVGWLHGDGEPKGMYVFTFTIHGTLNGNPLDLTGSSIPIRMT